MGDLAFKHPNLIGLTNVLNGKKVLLIGNHDKQKDIDILRENRWSVIDDVLICIDDQKKTASVMQKIRQRFSLTNKEQRFLCCYVADIDDKCIIFTHFPLFNDNPYDEKYNPITEILEYIYKEHDCDLNIHGHAHSRGAKEPFCVSACAELIDFKPVDLGGFVKSAIMYNE